MTHAQLRALLDAATKRPWLVGSQDYDACGNESCIHTTHDMSTPIMEAIQFGTDATAVVATMNAADALHDLWSALCSTGYTYRPDSEDPVERRIADALRRLEELP